MRFPVLCTLLLALAVSAAPVSAQETFAPLITESTVLFVHVDFQKAEVDTFKQNWMNYSEGLMKALHFEDASLRTALSALTQDLDKLDEYIRPTFETIVQKFGIKEAALIVDTENIGSASTPVVLVMPWKDKNDSDLETLLQLVGEDAANTLSIGFDTFKRDFVPAGDFLFLSSGIGLDKDKLDEWLRNANPVNDTGIMQAMNSLGDDDIKIAAAMTDTARGFLLEALKETNEFPEPVVNILTYVARKVEWTAISFPNPLFTPAVMEDMPPLKLTVKTRAAADARMLRSMLETSIDLAITAWRTAAMAAKAFNEDMPDTPEFFYAFSRGYLRTLLPVVEGDKLIFHQPDFGGRFWEFYAVAYGGMLHQMFFRMMPMIQPHAAHVGGAHSNIGIGEELGLYGRTIDNEEFNWDSFRGKYVLVKFTATWCGPCKAEIPGMLEAYEKYRDKGLEIVSVYVWEGDNAGIKHTVEQEKLPWTIISEPLTEEAGLPSLTETFIIGGVPTMLIVDKEGNVHATETRGARLQRILQGLFDE